MLEALPTKTMSFKRMLAFAKDSSISSFSTNDFEDDYELTPEVLSKDSKSTVFLGKRLFSEDLVSVKVIHNKGMKKSTYRRIVNEFKVLRKLEHPNIVTVYDIYDKDDGIYVVSELIAGDSLEKKLLDDNFEFREEDCKFILKTLISALKYCKDQGVVHRNLLPENIIFSNVSGRRRVKIVGFQWSKRLEVELMNFSLMETICGKPHFVAPEVLGGQCYNYKCDIWSLGVIFYLILSGGYLPFAGDGVQSSGDLLEKVKTAQLNFQPAMIWNEVSYEGKDLVKKMLMREPGARYSYEQLLAHKFFRNRSMIFHTKTTRGLIRKATRSTILSTRTARSTLCSAEC